MFVGDGETSERKTKDEKRISEIWHRTHTHTQVLVGFSSFICAIFMMYACGGEPGDVEKNPTAERLTPRSLPSPGDLPPEEESINQTFSDSTADPSTTPFIHPLKAWDASRGVLFRDVRDDEDGKRYAVGDSVRSYGNGAVVTSGIRTLEREAVSEEELRELVEQGRRHRPNNTKSEKIGPVLAKWLQEAGPEDQEPILVHFHRPAGFESHIYRMHHAISAGRIQTQADRANVREELLQAQRVEIDSYLTPLARVLEREGALILRSCESGFCMTIEAGPDTVRRLALMPEILRLDKGTGGTHENASISGQTVSFGAQMEQFQDLNYMGDYNWLSRGVIDVAVVEHNILRKSHPGFKESTTSTTRVQKTMDCTEQSGCVTSNHTSGYHFHPVAVAGLALGDLTDGQDPLYTSEYSRESRSGYGREANLLFYRAVGNVSIPTALDFIASEPAELLSMSISSFVNEDLSANPPIFEIDTDPDCLGQHPNALGVNTLFENGILTFVATGNNTHWDSSDCSVEDAANAIGALAVSLYTSDHDVADPIGEVRNGPIHYVSDRGGTWDSSGNILEGSGRTIIDLVAQGCRTMIFDEFGGYTEEECATSYAAPTAAGAAVQVMDHYRNNYSDLIYEPGMLAVNMLLMGDRETESGVKASSGFDSVWGAGRMKMRKWDTYGLDEPFEYADFLTCISDGENYIVWINQGLDIGTDVDVIKGVLYFYDHRHGGGNAIDNIDLILQKYTYNPFTMRWSWNTIVSSDSPTDEKERVYYEPNGGKYRFLIRGTDVTGTEEGCDAGSMMVYFAYYMEDSDRDDANGPDWTIDEEDTP